jgi:hypothetical protein
MLYFAGGMTVVLALRHNRGSDVRSTLSTAKQREPWTAEIPFTLRGWDDDEVA